MSFKHLKRFFYLMVSIFLILGLSLSLQSLLAAWAPPTSAPPASNVSAPLNEGGTNQAKLGGLGIGGNFAVIGNSSLGGNVGIGTTGPGDKLTVVGDIRATGAGSIIGVSDAAITQTFYMTYDSNFDGDILNNKATTGDIFIRPGNGARGTGLTLLANGNVGIGTAGPVQKVDIKAKAVTDNVNYGIASTISEAASFSTAGGFFENTGTGSGVTYGIFSQTTGAATTNIGGYFNATGATNNYGLIIESGNVGIGTTNPNELLEVNGNIRIGDGSGESLKLGTQRTLYRDGTALYIGEIDSSSIPLQFRSGGNDVMHITTTGNIGIGTTNPNSLTHIYQTSGNNAELDIQSVAGANKHWAIYHDRTTDDLRFWNNTPAGEKNILTMTNEGNVGVGIISPAAKLEVSGGAIKASGGLIIETRTGSDPASPVDGQIWLRPDCPGGAGC